MTGPFRVPFALKLRWSVEGPCRGGGRGPSELLPSPLLPALPISEAWAPSPLLSSVSPAPATLLAGLELRHWISSLGRPGGGKRCGELGAEVGSLLPRAPADPSSSPPLPRDDL